MIDAASIGLFLPRALGGPHWLLRTIIVLVVIGIAATVWRAPHGRS
jgi:hypothetical protein